jgi:filamentous hemagglutinin family protein
MHQAQSYIVLPATEEGVPSATDKAGRFPFSAVGSAVLVLATGLGLVACGGGGGGTSNTPASVNLSGQAIKGPVSGGQVCAYTLSSPRQQIACAITDANANYQLQLPAGTGEVLLEVTGGSYIDEATGQKVALTSPLRTLSKAGSESNALITPFTELAIQRATAGNSGGNLTLIGFQTQIGLLETGLGITGLATGKPFDGKSSADITHQKALEAFAKQQNAMGKTLGESLNVMALTLDKCGSSSLGATLAVYGQSSKSGALEAAKSTPQPSTTGNADIYIEGLNVQISSNLPSPCVDSFIVDGVAKPYADLLNAGASANSTSAKTVAITACGATAGLKAVFPQANISIVGHLATNGIATILNGTTNTNSGTSISTAGGAISPSIATVSIAGGYAFQMTGTDPIDLTASGLLLNEGCLLPATGNKGFGDITVAKVSTSNLTISQSRVILNWSTFNIGTDASVSFNQPNASSIGLQGISTSTSTIIFGKLSSNGQAWSQNQAGATLNSSGSGSLVVSGGALTTNGTPGSGSGGITVGSKSN